MPKVTLDTTGNESNASLIDKINIMFSEAFSGSAANTGTKTATAAAGAVTLSKPAGVITTEALTTAGLGAYTLTITNTAIAAADQVFASVALGTSSAGTPVIGTVTPAAGSVAIEVRNVHATVALNGTLKISFMSLKN